jgi:hypothetical protein
MRILLIARERLVAGLEGREFPNGTERLHWPAHGVDTFIPFTKPQIGDYGKVTSNSITLLYIVKNGLFLL